MTQNHTEIACIIDCSGSMSGQVDDTIGGFQHFLREQQKITESACLTLVLFSNKVKILCNPCLLPDVPALTHETYCPGGSTALLDAIGATVNNLSAKIQEKQQESGSRVMVIVITDGRENSSTDFSLEQIKQMVQSFTEKGWHFLFIGADEDTLFGAEEMGMKRESTLCIRNTNIVYEELTSQTTRFRKLEDIDSLEEGSEE